MTQTWHDLLFAHWPVEESALRKIVPAQLPLDTFQDQCWLGVVPFWMSNIRARFLPAIPGTSRFPELNVRTYVIHDGKPGVYFFSLDATNALAVWAARTFYHLPYFRAHIQAKLVGDEIEYISSRKENPSAEFSARYRPVAPARLAKRGSLEHWLSERYCLYTVHEETGYLAEIHHAQWPLQTATAEIRINTMAAAAGILLPSCSPLLHFSKKLKVLIWPLRNISQKR